MKFSTFYLKQETREFPGFRYTGCDIYLHDPSSEAKFFIKIHEDSVRRLFFELERPDSIIQAFIHDFIEEIVCYVPKSNSKCKAGFYETRRAEATVEPEEHNYTDYYRIAIRGSNLSSMIELYRQIRAGTIQPDSEW